MTEPLRVLLVLSSLLFFFTSEAVAQTNVEIEPGFVEFWNQSEERGKFDVDHSVYDAFLKKYVDVREGDINRIEYSSVSSTDEQTLNAYITRVCQMDPRQLTRARQLPYWLNLYNAGIISEILDDDPSASMRQVSSRSLWRKKRFQIAWHELSLGELEAGILRTMFDDPRIHFVMFKGALGSPQILNQAFTEANMEELLERSTRDFLNHPRAVDVVGSDLVLSDIFRWYSRDFAENPNELKEFIKRYVSPEMVQRIDATTDIEFDYNWLLNKP